MTDSRMASVRARGFTAVVGDESALTKLHVPTDVAVTPLELADVPATRQFLASRGIDTAKLAALSLNSDAVDMAAYGLVGSPSCSLLHAGDRLTDDLQQAIVVEAAAAAWRLRLADASTSLASIIPADRAPIRKPLIVNGRGLLTLLAERRCALTTLGGNAHGIEDTVSASRTIELASKIQNQITNGARTLGSFSDDRPMNDAKSALANEGWVRLIPMLVAANEIIAIELQLAAAESIRRSQRPALSAATLDTAFENFTRSRSMVDDLLAELEKALNSSRQSAKYRFRIQPKYRHRSLHDVLRVLEVTSTLTEGIWTRADKYPVPEPPELAPDKKLTTNALASAPVSSSDIAEILGQHFSDALPTARRRTA